MSSVEDTDQAMNGADKALLRYWLEKASQIMVIDPDINPWSFPILEHAKRAPSLIRTLQSVGAAHQQFFDPSKLARCLEERSCALKLVQKELTTRQAEDLFPVFLTVFVLGLSTAWINDPGPEWGYEHLRGARAIINMILHQEESSPFCEFMIEAYLYWDMACAFLVPSHLHEPLNTPEMFAAVSRCAQKYHPIGGYAIEIFYLLGSLGRYCRMVVDTGIRDLVLEATFEEQLTEWEPNRENIELGWISDAFRYHGLINLHAICYRRPDRHREADQMGYDAITDLFNAESHLDSTAQSVMPEQSTRIYALHVVRTLTQIPSSHPCTNIQAIPLLTAGSELTAEDCVERELVRQRFQAMYSLNHLRANLASLHLLEDLWALRDAGQTVTWLDLMLSRSWLLMLG
ncbi:unnamed protein product [Clonostachys byssicola]|uniref:Uncharacterized protein n=1 Tax=Clonostachys byssicola TaxID=160290 RepID=A0A9N9UKZ1_9HYPO|nr:unnamed protein product [Clonostachys byssicola]